MTDNIEIIRERINHTWSNEQKEIIFCDAREIIVGGGERAGKSFISADYLVVRWPWGNLFWIAGKDYDRCQAEFEYVAQCLVDLGAVKTTDVHMPRNGQWWMTLITGAVIKTWSLNDWLKVGSEAPDGIILAEAAQCSYQEYARLRDRTAEKRGWLFASGTFEGSLGWYPELWKQYQLPNQLGSSFSLPTWSNLFKFPGGRLNKEIVRLAQNAPSSEHFQERFGGIPCPPSGIVFKEARNNIHVTPLKIMDNTQIGLAIDPGYDAAYAILAVQIINGTIYVFDEIYLQGIITEDIIDHAKHKWAKWWSIENGSPAYGVVDIYGTQHQAMPAVVEVWQKKAGLNLTSKRVRESEGRERLHGFLRVNAIDNRPRVYIDPKCIGLLSELGLAPNPITHESAPYRWRTSRSGETIGKDPEDKNNHAIKALIYLIMDKFGNVDRNNRIKQKKKNRLVLKT